MRIAPSRTFCLACLFEEAKPSCTFAAIIPISPSGTCKVGRSSPAPPSAKVWRAVSAAARSEEHTSELQSLMRISYAVFCLKKKKERELITSRIINNNRPCRQLHPSPHDQV